MSEIDVLIPMYNAKSTIEDCINSVLKQTVEANIIICDDASKDESFNIVARLAEAHKNITIIKNEENLGYLKTFNKLLDKSSAEFVAFLDADDMYETEKLKRQLDFLNENPCTDAVGCNFKRIDEESNYCSVSSNLPLHHDEIFANLFNGNDVICGSSIMIRKGIISSVGGYREYFKGKVGEDIDWFSRIIQKHKVANIEYSGYIYRMSLSSLTRIVKYDVESIHIHDFIVELFRGRVARNKYEDIVDNNNFEQIELFFKRYKDIYNSYPCKLYSKTAVNHAINANYIQCIRDLRLCFQGKVNLLILIKTIIFVTIIRIFPNGFLMNLKERFGLNNLAKRFLS
ncbi:glycosyltransferase family 2 protein [Vibrio sp. 1159]|uniref:glycosyltransferase family 2 protein n=1 Tax=Vibrio sp. 1159 TaxID=3074545 RepID=UPI002963D1A3|nr:glycosyltransferase family 2 protein [Vibrio sp. 1159]MDW2318787.1 glycosyltransferase family 2 protein [Vibrio sp. 1159]